ncbi:MAG TPA: Ig domain-containing protein [Verrucomicrobiae bacterium]
MSKTSRLLRVATAGLCLWLAATETTSARDFRINQMPNGPVLGCLACHTSPVGGSARNAFGQAVFVAIGGSSAPVPFWTPALAALDSDSDGFCNGQELGDPDGDGVATIGAVVTNPGLSTSKPANAKPVFTSTPPLEATPGTLYQYQAAASDVDACQQLTFSKVAGPAWLTVSAAGLVSGTPPAGTSGDFAVAVAVADNGSPAQSAQQTFTLSVAAPSPFASWQKLHFNLPAEAALAAPLADPDGDRIVNLLEYAYRLNPRAPDKLEEPKPSFNGNQKMLLTIQMRDDDPALSARLVVADSTQFSPSNSIAGAISDPIPGDGWKTWTFEDMVSRTNAAARFGRILIELLP